MRCAVLNCRNKKNKDNSLYSFPQDEILRDKWLRFCGRDKLDLKRAVICSAHFSPEDCHNDVKFRLGYCRRRNLVPGAVPTLRPEDPREARIRKKDHRRLIEELLQKSTHKSSEIKTDNETPRTDEQNSIKKFLLADELPYTEKELKEDPFKDTNPNEEYLHQDDNANEDDEESTIDDFEEKQNGAEEIEDEPLIELESVNKNITQISQNQNGNIYVNKINFNVDFPLVPRTIILPLSTRTVGFIIRHIVSILWRLKLKDIELYRLTNALYRITLLQLDMKISTAMQNNFIRNSGGKAFINVTLPEPVRQILEDMRVNFTALSSFLSAIGIVRTPTVRYLPRYPRTKEDYPCDPVNVRFSLLRILVMRLTSTKTSPEIRRKFFELNPIPGAIWESCTANEEPFANPLLKNADDIMPSGYGLNNLRDDCNLIRCSIEKILKQYPKMVSTCGIDWRGKGSLAQLVSSNVIPLRCPTYNAENLTSIVGEHDHFWSLQNISKEEFFLGVFCLVGETGSVQYQECFAPRMLESSCQEGDLDFPTVIQRFFKQLL